MQRRLRVLLAAYACEPGKGSEPGVGWHVAFEMARHCDVTVLTRANNRAAIEAACQKAKGPVPDFLYHDLPAWVVRCKGRVLGVSAYYGLWQLTARRACRKRLDQFDLIHHVTFNAVQFPGHWAGLGLPVVLGPLGGGMTCPPALLPLFGKDKTREQWRTQLVHSLPRRRWWRRRIADAACVLAANEETAELLRRVRADAVPILLETAGPGADRVREQAPIQDGHQRRLRILWLGSLLPRKAPRLAMMAMAEVVKQRADVEMWMAGDGPERPLLQQGIERYGLANHVRLQGRLAKEEVAEWMRQGDLFLFSSLRDTSGNVMLEAMNEGLPVVALNHQGARVIGQSGVARLVEPGSPAETASALAAAILEFGDDEQRRRALGKAGQTHVQRELTWEQYGDRMLTYYQQAMRSAVE